MPSDLLFYVEGLFYLEKDDKVVETKLRFGLATSCTTNITRFMNNMGPLVSTILTDPSLKKKKFTSWVESNKRLRVQHRRHWHCPNEQSALDYRYIQQIKHLHVLESTLSYSCLYEKNHPNQVRSFNWVRSGQNGVFRFVKINRLSENAFIPPKWDPTSTQVISHLGVMIFLHVNRFCCTVPPRGDGSFSLDSVCFYSY